MKTDKTIDLDIVKTSNVKLDKEVVTNFAKSKEENKSCKKQSKYPSEYNTCKLYQVNKELYFRKYMEGLTKKIKTKIPIKFKKTLHNPKEKRVNRLACYVKLLLDISETSFCKNGRITISTIINKFENLYKNKDEIKQKLAKSYLEYLLTDKTISPESLKKFKTWYKKDTVFLETIKKIIDDVCK